MSKPNKPSNDDATIELASARDQLAYLLSFGRRIDLPTTFRGCGMYWGSIARANQEKEEQRQAKLNSLEKTEQQMANDALEILKRNPSLAQFKYSNFYGMELYPLWYFVLSGFPVQDIEEVFEMHKEALWEPLKKQPREQYEYDYDDRTWGGVLERADHRCNDRNRLYFLLEAACKPNSGVEDEVIAFLARKHPEARTIGFQQSVPLDHKILEGPRRAREGGTGHASLEVVKALVPDERWTLAFIANLISLGYSDSVLNHAVDMMSQLGERADPKKHGFFNISSMRDACLLDLPRALILERILCPLDNNEPTPNNQAALKGLVRMFECYPASWTPEGLNHTLKCLKTSKTVQSVGLGIGEEEDHANEETIVLLEELFATNRTIERLELRKVHNDLLAAIVRGLSRADTQTLKHLTLRGMNLPDVAVLEPFVATASSPLGLILIGTSVRGQWNAGLQLPSHVSLKLDRCKLPPDLMVETLNILPLPKRPPRLEIGDSVERAPRAGGPLDITQALSNVFGQGYLEHLAILGPTKSHELRVNALLDVLKGDNMLRFLEFQKDPNSQEDEEELVESLVDLMKYNTTIEQLLVHNKDRRTDYSGFSLKPKEMKTRNFCARWDRIFDAQKGQQMLHYMRLNKFGRLKVRSDSTTRKEFVALLERACTDLKTSDQLACVNVLFGLLSEFEPSKWIPGTEEGGAHPATTVEMPCDAPTPRALPPTQQRRAAHIDFSVWNVAMCDS